MYFRSTILLFAYLFLAVVCGCAQSEDPVSLEYQSNNNGHRNDDEIITTPSSAPRMAIVDYSTMDFSNDEDNADFARAEVIVTKTSAFWSSRYNDGKAEELRLLNPDIKLLGYVNAHGSWLMWGDDPEHDSENNPYAWDWYQATKPYWSYTTAGDTMMAWEGQVLLNILDPDCRAAMIQVFSDHWYAHENVMDGVFWDHFNKHLWVPTDLQGVDGQMDLDGDGVAHREDEDEMQAYRDASLDLILRFRAALGNDVIQVVNGGRAARDSLFAGEVDGMMYEHFPQVGFSGQSMREALDPNVENNLFAARNWPRSDNGGPWLILANKYRTTFIDDVGQRVEYRQAEFSRVAAMLTGCLVSYHCADQKMHYGWPEVEVHLGEATGLPEFDGDDISRNYEHGRLLVTITNGDAPYPFDFDIIQNSEVVQSLAFPVHFP